MTSDADIIRTLKEECETLRERVIQLESMLKVKASEVPEKWRISKGTETEILRILLRRRRNVTVEFLASVLWDQLPDGRPASWRNEVTVYIHALKRKLAPFGLEIKSELAGPHSTEYSIHQVRR